MCTRVTPVGPTPPNQRAVQHFGFKAYPIYPRRDLIFVFNSNHSTPIAPFRVSHQELLPAFQDRLPRNPIDPRPQSTNNSVYSNQGKESLCLQPQLFSAPPAQLSDPPSSPHNQHNRRLSERHLRAGFKVRARDGKVPLRQRLLHKDGLRGCGTALLDLRLFISGEFIPLYKV
jgi:hypothetical protein